MASPHTHSHLPNHPNYYWEMALIAFERNKIWECDMYLILFYQSTLGE
jgi:hypothetical protein